MEISKIPKLTEEETSGLRGLTAHVLPDTPSARGWTAAQIKAALSKAFVGEDAYNVAALIDRVVENLNACLDEIEDGFGTIERAYATVENGAEGSGARVTVTMEEEKKLHLHFTIPRGNTGERGPQGERGLQGVQGPKGDPFMISKTFSSVDEMHAGAATDGVLPGQYVAIDTNVENEDSAKVYIKRADGTYGFVVDLSGKEGIQGPVGPEGPQGPQGDPGPQGERGADGDDYVLTDTDRQEIVQMVLSELEENDENNWMLTEVAGYAVGLEIVDWKLTVDADPWTICDSSGAIVGDLSHDDPFDLSVLDTTQEYTVNQAWGEGTAKLIWAVPGDTGDGDGSLFNDEYIPVDGRYDLPAPVPGVSYVCEVNGEVLGPSTADEYGLYFADYGIVFEYQTIENWWRFVPFDSVISEGAVSVKVN